MEYTKTVGVVVLRGDEVLLVRHTEGATHHTGIVGVPAGRIQERESVKEAAVRELREESGLVIGEESLILLPRVFRATLDTKRGKENFEWTVFLCTSYSGELAPSDETEPFWAKVVDVDAMPKLENLSDALDDALRAYQELSID